VLEEAKDGLLSSRSEGRSRYGSRDLDIRYYGGFLTRHTSYRTWDIDMGGRLDQYLHLAGTQ